MGKFTDRDIKIGIGKEKISGTNSDVTADSLVDNVTSASPFSASMIGAQVVNTGTPATYSYITAFVDAGTVTLNDDIFDATPFTYEVAAPRGTQVAPGYWIPRRTFDFEDKATIVVNEQGLGVLEDSCEARVVSKWAEGSLNGVLRTKSVGLLLLNVFGEVASATPYDSPDSSIYRHTFSVRTNHQHPSFTLAVEDEVEEVAYTLCMVKTLTITADLGEYVLFTADMISKKSETASPALTPAFVAEKNFAAGNITFKEAATTATLAAATAVSIKTVEIVIDKEIEKDDVLSSVDPDDMLNKSFKITLTITKNLTNYTYRDYFKSATPRSMRITMEDSNAVAETGGTEHPKLEMDLNQVYITDWSTTKELDGIVTETLVAKATFKIADSEMAQVILENLEDTY